ncbi:hypothetical protein ONZ45_g4842 [Pleurotus djamor]|nr:hypothetical protein ONZ45_g4842 [Pleurotus djamor]
MPAARAHSKQPGRHDPVRRTPRRTSSELVINLTSSEDESGSPSSKRPTKKNTGPVNALDVIEISDDEDAIPLPPPRPSKKELQIRDLRKQLDQLREVNGQVAKDLERTQALLDDAQSTKEQLAREVVELKQLKQAPKTKHIDPMELEDSVNCEICTGKMWKPYILPECGHSFCESCLQDWFTTSLARHAQTHPGYDVNRPTAPIPAHMLMMHPQLHQILAMYDQANPQPEYTCPTCRVRVRTRPVEDFALKAIVRTVAQAEGENSPRKSAPTAAKNKGKKRQVLTSPWDAYFPKAPS